ncbi:hypothetical protein DFH06DRAFT_1088290 [Mycena polygramma]|nr:hypothetical protein DFH06DRAFT_1088290 [Mycena polygramma]
MPKATPSKTRDTEQDSLIVFTDGQKRVLALRPKTYKAAVDAARRHFPSIRAEDIVFQTDELAVCKDKMTDILPESWEAVVGVISSVSVAERREPTKQVVPIPVDLTALADDHRKIDITFSAGKNVRFTVRMYRHKPFERIRYYLEQHCGFDHCAVMEGLRMVNDDGGGRIDFPQTPNDLGMHDGAKVSIFQCQSAGKPVIYIYSPTETELSVALTLTPEWDFSTIYPVVPIKSNAGQCIQWNVRTHSDGSLTELNTGLDVAYLFWEAHTNHGIPLSPPASPAAAQFSPAESFSPLSSDLSPADSVLINVHDITPYLDKALLGLGLHTEARTSFITYWLPSFLKHTRVALRFVPQAAYETAAPLNISPAPDVVTRVFMLFKGIGDNAVGEWEEAQSGDNDAERWRGVVGVDVGRAADVSLLRVLEWGGMEVLAH